MDEYEENWFDSEEDELNSLNDTPSPTKTNDALSTKPLSSKLKDVDLLDNIPLKRTGSPPPIIRANSPNGTLSNCRPTSPQNNRKSINPTSSPPRPGSPINNVMKPLSPQNSSNSSKQENVLNNKNNITKTENWSVANNLPLVKNNNKPLIQIKINSTGVSLANNVANIENNVPTTNNITCSGTTNNKTNTQDSNNHVNMEANDTAAAHHKQMIIVTKKPVRI